jgi:hypothetical protein
MNFSEKVGFIPGTNGLNLDATFDILYNRLDLVLEAYGGVCSSPKFAEVPAEDRLKILRIFAFANIDNMIVSATQRAETAQFQKINADEVLCKQLHEASIVRGTPMTSLAMLLAQYNLSLDDLPQELVKPLNLQPVVPPDRMRRIQEERL